MKTKVIGIAIPIFLFLVLAMNYSVAENIEWSEGGLTAAFQKGAEEEKFLLVLASETITEEVAMDYILKLESPETTPFMKNFVCVRLVGEDAKKFQKDYGFVELPICAILHTCGTVQHELEPKEAFYESLIEFIVSGVKPLDLQGVLQVMQLAAKSLETGNRVQAALLERLAIFSLDKIIEENNKQKKQQNPEDNPLRADPRMQPGMKEQMGKEVPVQQQGDQAATDDSPRNGGRPDDVSFNDPDSSGTAQWGKLPPKLREDVSDSSGEEIPAAYRELVEEYFKSLMK